MILSGILHASLGGFTVIRGVAPLGDEDLIAASQVQCGRSGRARSAAD